MGIIYQFHYHINLLVVQDFVFVKNNQFLCERALFGFVFHNDFYNIGLKAGAVIQYMVEPLSNTTESEHANF